MVANQLNSRVCPPSPTPTFNARALRSAKWSSQEDVTSSSTHSGKLLIGPKVWTPRNAPPSPTPDSIRPIHFDSNSLKKHSKDKQGGKESNVNPKESFAWKDHSLEQKLEELHRARDSGSSGKILDNGFDRNIDSSIGNWSNLPRAPNQDVVLLKKAREEKKVKKYLEDNFQKGRIVGENDQIYEVKREYQSEDEDHTLHKMADLQPLQYKGLGPKTVDGMPIGLRSQIKEEQKGDWYKQVYNSIHRKGGGQSN